MDENTTLNSTVSTIREQEQAPASGSSLLTTIVFPTIFFVVFFLGIIGNSLIVYILKFPLKRICDIFLIHLAMADLLFLCTLPFWGIEFVLQKRWIFGNVICKITSWFTMFSAYGSVFFLSVISLDRLAVIVLNQILTKHRTNFKAYIAITIAWTLALAASLPSLHFRGTVYPVENNSDFAFCHWTFDNTSRSDTIWFGVQFGLRFVLGFAIPLFVIFTSYLTINMYLSRKKSQKKLLRKKQDRITATIWMMIFVFILCWLPNQISSFIFLAEGLDIIQPRSMTVVNTHANIHIFLTVLAYSHSCMNPILYAFMRDDVRGKLAEILHRLVMCCRCGTSTKYKRTSCSDENLKVPCNKLANGESLRCTSPTRITLLKKSSRRTDGQKVVEVRKNVNEELQDIHVTSVV